MVGVSKIDFCSRYLLRLKYYEEKREALLKELAKVQGKINHLNDKIEQAYLEAENEIGRRSRR